MKIKDVEYDTTFWGGCPTCDYGSNYINKFIIFYDNGEYDKFKIEKMYEYLISEADLMKVLSNFITREKLREDIVNFVKKFNENAVEKATLHINDETVIYGERY